MSRVPLVYALHSGRLYGTERMALATAEGLVDEFEPTIFAPPGEALDEAERLGMATCAFSSAKEFALRLRPVLAGHREVAFVATGVMHSLAFLAWNTLYRRRARHLHVVHGGTDEALSYGRKRKLNRAHVLFVAVSEFVRDKLVEHGVRGDRIRVVENFLAPSRIAAFPRRPAFERGGARRIVVVSRIDPIKRVDLLLDALDRSSALDDVSVRVLGNGWDVERLRERAARAHPNVTFVGFTDNVAEELREADVLCHTCPEEPFGLAILEAMAVGLPVVVPDAGGAGSLVEHGVSGYRFRRDDPDSLATTLERLRTAGSDELDAVVAGGRRALAERFSAARRTEDYRRLLKEETA